MSKYEDVQQHFEQTVDGCSREVMRDVWNVVAEAFPRHRNAGRELTNNGALHKPRTEAGLKQGVKNIVQEGFNEDDEVKEEVKRLKKKLKKEKKATKKANEAKEKVEKEKAEATKKANEAKEKVEKEKAEAAKEQEKVEKELKQRLSKAQLALAEAKATINDLKPDACPDCGIEGSPSVDIVLGFKDGKMQYGCAGCM